MSKLLKILGILIGGLVLLVVAAIIIIPMTFDPNDYKPQIISQVKENTGRDLTIEGDLELTVFPWIGITTGEIELGNAAGFTADVFARTKTVSARVKLLPLLSSEVEMDTVTLHGLVLNLEKNADGTTNWDDLAKSQGDAEASSTSKDSDATGIAALAIGGLDVKDANLTWDDRQQGQRVEVRNLNIETGAISPGDPVALDISFDVKADPQALSGAVRLAGTFAADPDKGAFAISDFEVEADLSGPSLPGGETKVALKADAAADLSAQTASLSNLVVDALGLQASGNVDVTGLQSAPEVSGQLEVKTFNPRDVLKALGQTVPETADPKALTALSLTTKLGGAPGNVELKPLQIKLDDSTLSGNVSYGSAIRFDLGIDEIDADRYLPPKSEPVAATPGAAAASAPLPVETLRALDVDGDFKIGKLKISNLNMSDVVTHLNAKGGVITLSPIGAKLYDGSYAGNIVVNAKGDTPKLSVDEKLTGIQAGPLLKDLTGQDALTGTGNAQAKLTASGVDAEAMKSTMNGTAAFNFTDGALNGVNIAQMIRDAKATIGGGKAGGDSEAPQRTDFTELGGTVKIKNGLATNNDFAAKSPLLRIEGTGTADLPSEALDYKVKATVVGTTKGQGGDELADLEGIPIPVHVTGTFSEPKYGLDMEAMATALAKSKAKDLIEGGVTGSAGKVLEGSASGTGELLKGATGGTEEATEAAGGLVKGLLGN